MNSMIYYFNNNREQHKDLCKTETEYLFGKIRISNTDQFQNLLENNHKLLQKPRGCDNDFTPEDQLLYSKTHNEKY